ncbi:uncharacterized protein BDW70DRAFT_145996 [Aspergillus foveolatus]|uniref:uncharacterized protein n=1 Tax=Aspergillus foveolatus TaxID=210207 RepID=UPI003CCCE261
MYSAGTSNLDTVKKKTHLGQRFEFLGPCHQRTAIRSLRGQSQDRTRAFIAIGLLLGEMLPLCMTLVQFLRYSDFHVCFLVSIISKGMEALILRKCQP